MGTLPAEVWGWLKNPSFSSSAMMLRIVAGLTPREYFVAMAFELTGSAVLM